MTLVSLAQVFLASFLVGIYFFDVKIGSSPFVLVRNEMPFASAPIFQDPQYLSKYWRDGNGLNVLLQNYWMTIHPPGDIPGVCIHPFPFFFCLCRSLEKGFFRLDKACYALGIVQRSYVGDRDHDGSSLGL